VDESDDAGRFEQLEQEISQLNAALNELKGGEGLSLRLSNLSASFPRHFALSSTSADANYEEEVLRARNNDFECQCQLLSDVGVKSDDQPVNDSTNG
jgi:hypothetical protein